jgi:hypothetical protein
MAHTRAATFTIRKSLALAALLRRNADELRRVLDADAQAAAAWRGPRGLTLLHVAAPVDCGEALVAPLAAAGVPPDASVAADWAGEVEDWLKAQRMKAVPDHMFRGSRPPLIVAALLDRAAAVAALLDAGAYTCSAGARAVRRCC